MRTLMITTAATYANERRTIASRILLGLTIGAVAGWTLGGLA